MRDLMTWLRSPRCPEILRYLLAGTAITLAAHGVYLLALYMGLAPHPAWAVSFAFGTAIGYVIHRRFVFRAQARRRHWISFPAAYLLRFAIGEGLLTVLLVVETTPGWAGFIANLAMAPIGFVLLRTVLRERPEADGEAASFAGRERSSS